MTIPTNWPNPERPGVPLFPEYVGEHILKELLSGKEVHALWNNEQSCWDVVALYEQTPKTVSQYFHYIRCKCVRLTPTQIAEMLAEERERCAKVCEDAYEESGRDFEYLGCNDAASQIRNLGAAP